VETARKGIFKERPHNSHPCEFAMNGFIQEIKKWNPQGTVLCKERNLQGMDFARNADYVVLRRRQYLACYTCRPIIM